MFLINILLVDDHELFSKSLAIALEEYDEIQNFYTTQDLSSLPEQVCNKKIDIVLMDINLGKLTEQDGLTVALRLQKTIPSLKIIMLTGYDLPVYKYEAKKMGVAGFLNKNINPDELVASLLCVYHGHSCFQSEKQDIVIEELTSVEKQILQLIATGKKRKEIAGQLYISERTLSNHLQHIYEKLGVTSSIEAVTKALQMGYIAPLH